MLTICRWIAALDLSHYGESGRYVLSAAPSSYGVATHRNASEGPLHDADEEHPQEKGGSPMAVASRLMRKSKNQIKEAVSPSPRSSIRVLRNEAEIREAYERVVHFERRNAVLVNKRVAHYEKKHSLGGRPSNDTVLKPEPVYSLRPFASTRVLVVWVSIEPRNQSVDGIISSADDIICFEPSNELADSPPVGHQPDPRKPASLGTAVRHS